MLTKFIYILFLTFLLNTKKSKGVICFKTRKVGYRTENDYGNYTISINDRPNNLSANMTIDLVKPMNEFIFAILLQYKVNNGRKTTAVNATMNFCDVVGGKRRDPFIWALLSEWKKSITLPQTCPIEKGHYSVSDFSFHAEFLQFLLKKGTVFADWTVKDKTENGNLKTFVIGSSITDFYVKQKFGDCRK